jgi:hypothetical protein
MPSSIPAHIAVVSARIPQFDALAETDRLRAAALALKRDFNIDETQLKLAARSVGDGGRVLIAYTTNSRRSDESVDARWFDAVMHDAIYWVGAPGGIVLSNGGAAAVEHWSLADGIPAPIMSLVSQAVVRGTSERVRVIVDDPSGAIDESTLQLWGASLGVAVERGPLPGAPKPIALVAPPVAATSQRASGLDRALQAGACVAAACALFAVLRYANLPAANTSATPSTTNAASGELWATATLASPALAEAMKSASYGGGAWVIVAPPLERTALPAVERAIAASGLAVQAIAEPEPRVRVRRP